MPFNFTDPERDEPIVVETWWLPKDVQSRLWRIPINEYGFVRAPSLAALYEKVLVGADETCTFVASDEVVES